MNSKRGFLKIEALCVRCWNVSMMGNECQGACSVSYLECRGRAVSRAGSAVLAFTSWDILLRNVSKLLLSAAGGAVIRISATIRCL